MKAERRDFAIREVGCVACHEFHGKRQDCEKHHLNAFDMPGAKRRGEEYTVGLCQWHHVGRCACSGVMTDCSFCSIVRGPSWRHHKRDFLTAFGTGDELLEKQNARLREWADNTIGVTYEQLGCEMIG